MVGWQALESLLNNYRARHAQCVSGAAMPGKYMLMSMADDYAGLGNQFPSIVTGDPLTGPLQLHTISSAQHLGLLLQKPPMPTTSRASQATEKCVYLKECTANMSDLKDVSTSSLLAPLCLGKATDALWTFKESEPTANVRRRLWHAQDSSWR